MGFLAGESEHGDGTFAGIMGCAVRIAGYIGGYGGGAADAEEGSGSSVIWKGKFRYFRWVFVI